MPAKVLKFRFPKEIINELIKIDYSKMTPTDIIRNKKAFCGKIESVSQVKKILENVPQKSEYFKIMS